MYVRLTECFRPRKQKTLIKLFSELPLSAYVQERLSSAKFVTPTPVQAAAIPHALEGKDILATAQTGTGKTLAFLLPIMEQLLDKPATGIEAMVLVPTRELAMQVTEQYNNLRGKKLPAAAVVVGGMSEKDQIKSLRSGARLVVATPGRLEDFMKRRLVQFKELRIIVLDESDRMLDMGFIAAIRRIMAALPKQRQTLCFSATLEASVVHLMTDYLRNPVRLAFGSTLKPSESVKLHAYVVNTNQKVGLLQRLLAKETGRCLVFVRTKRGADRLAKQLVRDGFSAAVIHGDRSQSQRNAALLGFQTDRHRILVATDVASRGIHVQDVAQVINYELPEIAEDFVHRVGRTGRAGGRGIASTFINVQDMADFKKLERTLSIRMEKMTVDGDLPIEERNKPIDVANLAPMRAIKQSKMVLLPGENLQRYGNA